MNEFRNLWLEAVLLVLCIAVLLANTAQQYVDNSPIMRGMR